MTANDSLHNLVGNVPDWLKRLEDLSDQIEQRQEDLARLPENQSQSSARSLRNRGSTESLKPADDAAAIPAQRPDPEPSSPFPPPPPLPPAPAPAQGAPQDNTCRSPGHPKPPPTPASEPKSGSTLLRQEVTAAAQRRVRATVRRKPKTESMLSHEDSVPKYRSRKMIIVYYDSYVQSFFEELVKFVSAQRNGMRKAKMAAKVAQIKRMAELEMPDDEDEEGEELKPGDGLIAADPATSRPNPGPDSTEELRLRYLASRRSGPGFRNPAINMMHARGRAGGLGGGLGMFNDKGDIWDELDKGLEYVQGMCEHAAHQFLRDGDCNDEIEKIKQRLAQTREAADRELARQRDEKPEGEAAPTPIEEPVRSRTYRPMTMRRDNGASNPSKASPKKDVIEVDDDDDEGFQDMDDFKPVHKSTRLMNGRA
ncbi:hypothetical protein F4780DRAFT_177718 [Xylariomycetidae sp. FL0641]|nr:hypothetical protein F4780DRAFT_177718 [Xylariomycetidae sp. FL0641]